MRRQLINGYGADLDRIGLLSINRRGSMLRQAIDHLLKQWDCPRTLLIVPEHAIAAPQQNRISESASIQ